MGQESSVHVVADKFLGAIKEGEGLLIFFYNYLYRTYMYVFRAWGLKWTHHTHAQVG